jgi:hypothetical protein
MRHEALQQLIDERRATPFAWGAADCAMWAFDAVQAATGRDPAAGLRGRYTCARTAMRTLRDEGGLQRMCARRIGPEVLPGQAVDGDVLLLRADVCTGPAAECGALAIKWGPLALAQGQAGLVALPLDAATHAWRAA